MVFQVRNAQRSGAIGVIIYGEFDSLVFLSLSLFVHLLLSIFLFLNNILPFMSPSSSLFPYIPSLPLSLPPPDNAGRSQNNDSKPPFPFSMSGDENMSDVLIPSLFITHSDGQRLLQLRKDGQSVNVLLTWLTPEDMKRHSVQSILGAGESSTSEKGKESEASTEDREENIWPPPPPPSSSSSLP